MWNDYKHYLIPKNPNYVPGKNVIVQIDQVLDQWGMKKTNPAIFNLSGGKNIQIQASLNELDFYGGIALKYAGLEGRLAEEIIGESHYGCLDEETQRSIQSITFIVGWDYRIHPSSEHLRIVVVDPPKEQSLSLNPYCHKDEILHVGLGKDLCLAKFSGDFLGVDVFQYYGHHAEAYTSTENTSAPKVRIEASNRRRTIGSQPFEGYWRTAVIFDYGNDLPKLDDAVYKIKSQALVKDLENALGTDVIEIGHFY